MERTATLIIPLALQTLREPHHNYLAIVIQTFTGLAPSPSYSASHFASLFVRKVLFVSVPFGVWTPHAQVFEAVFFLALVIDLFPYFNYLL